MDKIQEKKFQILNDVCTSKDGLSWNELTEDLNKLIEIVRSEPTPTKCNCGQNAIPYKAISETDSCARCGNAR